MLGRHQPDARESRAVSHEVDDRLVVNCILWVLRSCAPYCDLPKINGHRTTCYNRFVRCAGANGRSLLMLMHIGGKRGAASDREFYTFV
jgi:transposase